MKTLKIILFAAIAMFGFVSCSDEKKALKFVSEEFVSDSELNDFLIRNKIAVFKDSFEPELRYYLASIMDKKNTDFCKVYLSDEFAHHNVDLWEYFRHDNKVDSDRILNTILQLTQNKLDSILSNDTINYDEFSSHHWTKERMFNYILSQATCKARSVAMDEMEQSGLFSDIVKNFHEKYSFIELYDPENYEIGYNYDQSVNAFLYDWLVLGLKNKQWTVIEEVVCWIVSSCRDEVMSKNYKLVDKQCTTIGENQYKVTYLLDPHFEIIFTVKKIGKTFVCENYTIDGNVFIL